MPTSSPWVAEPPVSADRWAAPLLAAAAASAVLLLALVMAFLLREAAPALGSASLLSLSWIPAEGQYGVMAMAIASGLTLVVALGIAVPIGLGAAIHVRFLAGAQLAALLRSALALLAGVPSVVFGLWGLTELVPLLAQWRAPGASLLAAACVLALMVLPTVALTSLAALEAVPRNWLQGGAALGLSQRALVLGVALPAARQGIRAGIALAAARAMGETMAVLMVSGNVVQVPDSVFQPVRLLTAHVALEMAYAVDTHRAALFAAGLVLTVTAWGLAWLGRMKEISHAR